MDKYVIYISMSNLEIVVKHPVAILLEDLIDIYLYIDSHLHATHYETVQFSFNEFFFDNREHIESTLKNRVYG